MQDAESSCHSSKEYSPSSDVDECSGMGETGIEELVKSDTNKHDDDDDDDDDVDDDKWLYTSGIAVTPLFEGSSLTVLQALVKYFS